MQCLIKLEATLATSKYFILAMLCAGFAFLIDFAPSIRFNLNLRLIYLGLVELEILQHRDTPIEKYKKFFRFVTSQATNLIVQVLEGAPAVVEILLGCKLTKQSLWRSKPVWQATVAINRNPSAARFMSNQP